MSVHLLNSINPFLRLVKKNIRRWIFNIVFFLLVFILFPLWHGYGERLDEDNPLKPLHKGASTLLFLFCSLILIIIYFKNISKNALLKSSISDYENIEKFDLFVEPYRKLFRYSKWIFWVDFLTFPVSFPLKFVFWINYRKLKRRLRQLKRKVIRGEKTIKDSSIEKDPFYDFLIREGLYGTKKKTAEEKKSEEEELKQSTPADPRISRDIKDNIGAR